GSRVAEEGRSEPLGLTDHALDATDRRPGHRTGPGTIRPKGDNGVQDAQERLEVAVAGRGKERIDHTASHLEVRVWIRRLGTDAPASPARELPRGGRCSIHDRSDL